VIFASFCRRERPLTVSRSVFGIRNGSDHRTGTIGDKLVYTFSKSIGTKG
jgi:hypothetical protein